LVVVETFANSFGPRLYNCNILKIVDISSTPEQWTIWGRRAKSNGTPWFAVKKSGTAWKR